MQGGRGRRGSSERAENVAEGEDGGQNVAQMKSRGLEGKQH